MLMSAGDRSPSGLRIPASASGTVERSEAASLPGVSRRRGAALALLALAPAIVGCSMVPRYERPPAPVAQRFPGTDTPGDGTVAADIAWRSFFADERLQRLIELALENNRDLRVATLEVERSQARYRIQRSSSVPTVTADGSFTRQHASGLTANQWAASVGTTSYELDLFGRVRSLNHEALERYFATEEAQRSQHISAVAEVGTEYFTLRVAEEQLVLARQTLTAVQEAYRINQLLFEAGASNEMDVRTAEGEVQTATINVITYQRQLAEAEDALTLQVGQPLPVDLPAARPFQDAGLVAEIPVGLPSDLIQRRPDVLEAEHTLKAANANIGAARAAFFPTISLTGSVGTASSQLSGLFGSGSGTWTFLPQVSIPIFSGGKNRSNLDVAKVSARIEVANYEKAIQTAFREVADALAGARTYADQIAAERRAIGAQQRRLEVATARYHGGDDSYLDVLSAQQGLYSAQQGLLQAQFNRLSSEISLYKALGGGWQ
jgi:multidrug efflux system outer membrane protein